MSVEIEGVVLATSRKNSGYCAVVLELSTNRIYRIVSDDKFRNGNSLMEPEIIATNGKRIENLDIVKLYVKSMNPVSNQFQHENLIFDNTRKIVTIGHMDKNELVEAYGDYNLNDSKKIFANEWPSMTIAEALKCETSFLVSRVYGLEFYSVPDSKGENSCKCKFKYNKIVYEGFNVTISDTKEADIRKYSGKRYPCALVCFSFGEPYKVSGASTEKCFKFMCSFLGYWKYY